MFKKKLYKVSVLIVKHKDETLEISRSSHITYYVTARSKKGAKRKAYKSLRDTLPTEVICINKPVSLCKVHN